jgi:hypothetical protein
VTLALAIALCHSGVLLGRPVAAAESQFFPQTGYTVSGPFLSFWQTHGGLPIFGYPISELQTVTDPNSGARRPVQWFERARFELHAENSAPYQVELGLLGSDATQGRQNEPPFQPVAPFQNSADRVFFAPTSHSLAYGFKAFWQANGALPIFGYPLSEEFQEQNPADGRNYTVQYFERARFEYHPANPPEAQVQLGLLGDQLIHTAPSSVTIAVASGSTQTTIGPDQTALVPAGTTSLTVSLQYPQPVDQQSFQVQLAQLAGQNQWQLAPTGQMPTRNGYIFGLRSSPGSPSYLRVEVIRGTGNPAVFFGIQLNNSSLSPPLVADWNDPVALLNSYYNAVNRHEYERAYSYWEHPGDPNSAPASFADFANGYAGTASVAVTTGPVVDGAAAGNIYFAVPTVLAATQTDGSLQRFAGCYLMHRANVETGDTTPPYPIGIRAARITAAPAGADPAALLNQAIAFVQSGQCTQ